MTGTERTDPRDQRLADLLAHFDELLASGVPVSEMDTTAPLAPDLLQRLHKARACLQMLEQVHPRRSRSTVLGTPERPGPDRLAAGTLVGHYRLLGKLGRGGMGVVYRAHDTRLGREVAVKFLPAEFAHDADRLERFVREARTASALNHPHICTVHELGEHERQPFLVMELIEGQTLQSLVGQRVGLDGLAQLIGQAARALAVAHTAGIVHRDVKPENLMVRPDGYVKVVDFGLARRLPVESQADAARPGLLAGTVQYMSPEQARSQSVSSASDVFSLGIVLYELATGQHPFPGETILAILYAIARKEPLRPSRLNPEVSPSLETLIDRMLAKDPAARPTAAEVDAALSALAGRRADWPVRPAVTVPLRPSVGRRTERAALWAAWERATAGRGSLLCVTGEPGLGKTTLIEDFLSDLQSAGIHGRTARGRCSDAMAGAEPYQPFLQALEGLLRGDDAESMARLMRQVAPTWYVQVAPHAEAGYRTGLADEAGASSQSRMRRELTALLEELSRHGPMLLFLDDVHWADVSTVDLLSHLGSRCGGMRLLLVVTYRPTELLLASHPFRQVRLDLEARGVCREVELGFLTRADVDSYLGLTFPGHELPPTFGDLIHDKTEGNPLFMVDLLRYLRERGVLARSEGRWVLARSLPDLQRELPPSIRSLIQRKLDLLDPGDHRLLSLASVQGLAFDSAVLVSVLNLEAVHVEERLQELHHVHGLVRLVREQEFSGRTLSLRYAFVHSLYQDALAGGLSPSRRAAWSGQAANVLVGLLGDGAPTQAAELAVLFETGREFTRAAEMFLSAAGNAGRVYAHMDALALARRGLACLAGLPQTAALARLELDLRMSLALQLQVTQGFAAAEAEQVYTRARALCELIGPEAPLFEVLWGLMLFYKVRSDLKTARQLAEQLFHLAEKSDDPGRRLQARQALSVTALCSGEPATVREQMEQACVLYDPERHRAQTARYGQDPCVACSSFGAVALWLLGHPDQAERRSNEVLEWSQRLSQPSTQSLALHFAAMLRQLRREAGATRELAEASFALAAEHGLAFWQAGAMVLRGWARAEQGELEAGIEEIRQGLSAWEATESETYRTYYLALLAEMLGRAGRHEDALKAIDEATGLMERTGERLYEPELYRLRGELSIALWPEDRARVEEEFDRAVACARRQGARSLELRAQMSRVRLTGGGRGELAELVASFVEGRDTPDLVAARALLES